MLSQPTRRNVGKCVGKCVAVNTLAIPLRNAGYSTQPVKTSTTPRTAPQMFGELFLDGCRDLSHSVRFHLSLRRDAVQKIARGAPAAGSYREAVPAKLPLFVSDDARAERDGAESAERISLIKRFRLRTRGLQRGNEYSLASRARVQLRTDPRLSFSLLQLLI